MKHFSLLPTALTISLIISGMWSQPIAYNVDDAAPVTGNYTSFVYKACANESLAEPTRLRSWEALLSLLDELKSKSSHSTCFKSVVGDEDVGISGRFQCRGDMLASECHACVTRIQELSRDLCNNSVSAKIQLAGCHVRYEIDGAGVAPNSRAKYEVQHKKCGAEYGGDVGGYEGKLNGAFEVLESGVVVENQDGNGGGGKNGYYATDYASFHVAAQCEGDLGPCDCGECVSEAVQIAQEECGAAMDGEVFMDRCTVSFHYYPEGQSGIQGGGGGGPFNPGGGQNNGNGDDTGKEVAIVLGGAAALLVAFLFMLLVRSCSSKDDGD